MNADFTVKLGDPTSAEPVTLQELKDQLKIDFDTDNTLLTLLVSAARDRIERWAGVSLVHRSVNNIVKLDGCNLYELPYGPVSDSNSVTVTFLSLSGGSMMSLGPTWFIGEDGEFMQIKPPDAAMYAITYNAGYDVVPAALKTAVLHQAAYMYEHRGDESGIDGLSPTAMMLAKAYRRVVI